MSDILRRVLEGAKAAAAETPYEPCPYDSIIAGSLAFKIADRAAVSDIEMYGTRCGQDNQARPLYDTRPMLDPREHSDDCVEMARQTIAYAASRGLVRQASSESPHIVVVVRMPE